MVVYFLFGLSIRALEVTAICVVKFLITCLVSEILKNKAGTIKTASHPPSWILKKSMTSQGENFSLQEAISLYVQR